MPLYEYECTECHRHTEKIQKFSDPEITTCPHCGGGLKRVISAPAFSLKGGGWYADGYGSAKPKSGTSEGGSEGGSKETATKDGGSKDGGSKDTGAKSAPTEASSATPAPSAPAPAAAPAASSAKD